MFLLISCATPNWRIFLLNPIGFWSYSIPGKEGNTAKTTRGAICHIKTLNLFLEAAMSQHELDINNIFNW